MCPAKTAEAIEMPFVSDLRGPKERCARLGRDSPTEKSNCGGCSAYLKALRVSAAVYAAKGIVQATIMTVAAKCNAPEWSMSYFIHITLSPREKSDPPVMRPFVKIL